MDMIVFGLSGYCIPKLGCCVQSREYISAMIVIVSRWVTGILNWRMGLGKKEPCGREKNI